MKCVAAQFSAWSGSGVFFTHYHSDHTVGLPDFWLTGWIPVWFAARLSPLRIIGPTGATELADNLEKAYAADIKIRVVDEKYDPEGAQLNVMQFDQEGTVYDKGDVKVFAFKVDHGDLIKPAYGYKISYRGRSVVISGDTRFSENLIKHATGADLLVHEVAAINQELLAKSVVFQAIFAHHTSPQEAGDVFTKTHPKLAVYTHLVLIGSKDYPKPSLDELERQTRQTCSGPLLIGSDLNAFEIGADGVRAMLNASRTPDGQNRSLIQ
jgi:ribonuclease Z